MPFLSSIGATGPDPPSPSPMVLETVPETVPLTDSQPEQRAGLHFGRGACIASGLARANGLLLAHGASTFDVCVWGGGGGPSGVGDVSRFYNPLQCPSTGFASSQQAASMREMGKNHSSVVVLRIRPKFRWMLPMGVRDNHTKYEPDTQRWRPGTGVASAGPPFQNLQFRAKISPFPPLDLLKTAK